MSKSAEPKAPGWLTSQPIAHRGLHDSAAGIAENSLSAFRQAMQAGLPIELDVHLSADGLPVVFHDDTLIRMTGDPRAVKQVSFAELTALKLDSGPDTLPGLMEVLQVVNGTVPLVIELKHDPEGPDRLSQTVHEALTGYGGDFSIQSFDPWILQWFRLNAPHIIRGQLAMKSPPKKMPLHRKFMMGQMLFNRMSAPHYIGYDVRDVHSWPVRRVRRRNIPALAWTVTRQDQLDHARKHADNVIFETLTPDLVRKPGCSPKSKSP
ncbi:glycerophosphodiester phosphodiesterase family protein [Sneathiella chinensis]|uniref:Glycerophosphoryl diester phosphodiesterase n=1 Tax=Sneathiella chinensis TaxID=349750 RepID=A0ABQ5U7H6_9PROT|nr:glycerophosphodiester phosphodiesterase family protein [Sneathiella chinensis]GLQ07685.1 glycerophosphoryl diester phosphodiesterase [Sneathiella chinensis]